MILATFIQLALAARDLGRRARIEARLYDGANRVNQNDVCGLDVGRRGAGAEQSSIRESTQLTALTAKSNLQNERWRGPKSLQHVLAVTAGTNADEDVARLSKRSDLAGEDILE
jgi:hypothetical protein